MRPIDDQNIGIENDNATNEQHQVFDFVITPIDKEMVLPTVCQPAILPPRTDQYDYTNARDCILADVNRYKSLVTPTPIIIDRLIEFLNELIIDPKKVSSFFSANTPSFNETIDIIMPEFALKLWTIGNPTNLNLLHELVMVLIEIYEKNDMVTMRYLLYRLEQKQKSITPNVPVDKKYIEYFIKKWIHIIFIKCKLSLLSSCALPLSKLTLIGNLDIQFKST